MKVPSLRTEATPPDMPYSGTATDRFTDVLTAFGDRPALSGTDGAAFTYAEVATALNDVERFITDQDLSGARVATILPNAPSTLITVAGLCEVATAVPINPELTPVERRAYLSAAGASVLLVDTVSDEVMTLADDLDLGVVHLSPGTEDTSAIRLDVVRKSPAVSLPAQDIALLLATSGSTGTPKRVPLSGHALRTSARTIAETLRLGPDDVAVHMLPMFHIGAFVDLFYAPLMAGGQVRVTGGVATEALIDTVIESDATWFQAVPTVLKSLLLTADATQWKKMASRLRFIRAVSAGLHASVQADIEEKLNGVPVIQMYGMTETAGQIASNLLPPDIRKPGSVGLCQGADVAILDRVGNPVVGGTEGEVCVSGPTVTDGYEGMSRQSLFFGKWLRTGDLGYLDADGFLFLTGRIKDIINRGGEKIASVEVEQCLQQFPDVVHAAAYPVQHDSLGEEVGAAVTLTPGASVDQSTLLSFMSAALAPHKVPRRVMVLDKLPALASGKVDKVALRRMAEGESPSECPNGALSPLGRRIAAIWAATLSTPVPEPHDDFFDAGGDSLMVQTFLLELESALDVQIPANLLYEAPTLAAFAKAFENLEQSARTVDLPGDVYDAVRSVTAGWKGARQSEHSLIVGLHGSGQKTPFFFCVAAQAQFADLSVELGSDRPFYAIRTLSGLNLADGEKELLLAQHYADEINMLMPDGPVLLGGHCHGALLARDIGRLLMAKGRHVGLTVIVDRVMTQAYASPVAAIWSSTSKYSAISHYLEPERGLAHLYPNGAWSVRLRASHEDVVTSESVAEIAAFLTPLLDGTEDTSPVLAAPYSPSDVEQMLAERRMLHAAEIELDAPRFASPKERLAVRATVTNLSAVSWSPTSESGLRLLVKWQRLNGRIIDEIVGSADLKEIVPPGTRVTLELDIQYPDRRSPLMLYVDMVDEGVDWFHTRGTGLARRLVVRRYW